MTTTRKSDAQSGIINSGLLADAITVAAWRARCIVRLPGDLGHAAYVWTVQRIRLARLSRSLHLAAAGLFLEGEDQYVECPHWQASCEASS